MGLLDDAIREHLELKRRNGADPGEIARKKNEALAPVFPPEDGQGYDDAEQTGQEAGLAPEPAPEKVAAGPDEPPDEACGFQHGQETAELDMQAVLDADDRPVEPASRASASTALPVRAAPAHASDVEDLDWEAPSAGELTDAPEVIPGQERLSFE
jgi:hypothetical protein